MLGLRQEQDDDFWAVEALFDLCFGPGREALSSYRLREGSPPVAELSLVACDEDGSLAGAIRHWPVRVGGTPALLLGPIAVHPTRQGEGIAPLLIGSSLERAEGWDRVLLVGDLTYFGRLGFQRLDRVTMPPPTNPARVLGRALADGAWDGVAGAVTPWRNAP